MGSGKRDLEIIYNLQWKNVQGYGDDKANIVGMYDIPATTLNWETFKSYLLKNSGATGDDVKVSYVSIDGKEFPIESQLDFQIALYSFRQRARNGDIITLKLDRIPELGRMGRMKRLRRSAEPRMEDDKAEVVAEPPAANQAMQSSGPPDWFKKYMKGLKKEIVEDVTAAVVNSLSNMKTQSSPPFPCHHTRKSKMECCKRPRKAQLPLSIADNNEKEVMKSIKLERKLDNKLEKLEQKTIKIKEKKMALTRSSDGEGRISNKSRPIGMPLSDAEFLMDASALGRHELTIPHMSGGETYQQEWEVLNTGEMPWTSNTELCYAWGSEALKPVEKSVPCPQLNPGEKGTVVVYLEIPRKPGNYECYWHFYHEGRRFGHWLGCQVVVDPPAIKLPLTSHTCLVDTPEKETISKSFTAASWSSTPKKPKTDDAAFNPASVGSNITLNHDLKFCLMSKVDDKPLNTSLEYIKTKSTEDEIRDMSSSLQELQINSKPVISDANSSSDSDNQSIVSIADSNSSINSAPSDEFVVVAMPQCFSVGDENIPCNDKETGNLCIPVNATIKVEKIDADDVGSSRMENGDTNNNTEEAVVATEKNESVIEIEEESPTKTTIINKSQQPEPETKMEGYAYVIFNGEKIAVPKCLLRTDYLETAEDAPAPTLIPFGDDIAVDTKQNTPASNEVANNEQTETNSIQDPNVTQSVLSLTESPIKDSHVADSTQFNTEEPLSAETCPGKSRLFVFPLNCPGFEVVYPPNLASESLPPVLSLDANQSTKLSDESTSMAHSCMYANTYPPMCSHYEESGPEHTFDYSWSKSSTAYSYQPSNSHMNSSPSSVEFDPNSPSAPNGNSYHEATSAEAAGRNKLHHRFGSLMRHRSPFNHAKHCSGVRCQQPLFRSYSQGSARSTASALPKQYKVFVARKCTPPNPSTNAYPSPPPPPPPFWSSNPDSAYQHACGGYATSAATSSANMQTQSPPPMAAPTILTNTDRSTTMHILPDTLVSGAVNVASSAINTARSVLNMFSPPPRQEQGKWENSHWAANDPESPRERALRVLSEMGFWDRDLNATLLARYNDDLARVISELVQ